MMLASVPSSVTRRVSRETNEENNTTHRAKGLARMCDVPWWWDDCRIKSRFRFPSKRRRTTPLVSRRSMRDTTRYMCVCDTDTRDMWCDTNIVSKTMALFGSECVVHERYVSAVFDKTEATKTRLSYVFFIVVDSHHHHHLWIYSGWNVCGLSYHVTEIG